MAPTVMHWFAFDDLAFDLPLAIEIFQAKHGHKPSILWTRDGQPAPEGFGLVVKADGKLGEKELFLE